MGEHYWNTELNGKTVSSVKVEQNVVTFIFTDATHATVEGFMDDEPDGIVECNSGVILDIHQPENDRKVIWP